MKSGLAIVLAQFALILGVPVPAQTAQTSEIEQLRVQLEALKQQQALSQQMIASLEKKVEAMEKAPPPSPAQPVSPQAAAQFPPKVVLTPQIDQHAPAMQMRALFSGNRIAAARIDNVPLTPDMEGFFQLGDSPTLMRFGGYAKVDLIHDFKLPGNPDAFITSGFPLEPVPAADSTNVHTRQSRVSAEIRHPTQWGGDLRVYFESDFFGAGDTIFHLRQLYGQVHNLLLGWTYSTFMDIDSFPDTVDFEGPGGGIFVAQPQFRYTWPLTKANSIAFGVEKPTTDINITNPVNDEQAATPTTPIPDFVVRYRYDTSKGHLQFGSLFRSVGGFAPANTSTDFLSKHVFGWGLNLSGAVQTYKNDNIVFQGAYGDGIGRYLQDLAGLGADASLNASNRLVATPALGTFAAYQHYWTSTLRSTGTYGYAHVQPQQGQPATFYKKTNYASFNFIWNPAGSLNLGAEYMYGNLAVKDGDRGFGSRLQLSMQYNFFRWSKDTQ
jgi:DcaP outer membrane protein